MRSKIYNLKKSFMKVRRSSSKDVEEAMAGGLNKVILQHMHKGTRWCCRQKCKPLIFQSEIFMPPMWEDTNWVTLPKKETEGEKVKKNDLNFWESVSISKIFGQNSLQRQDREFAWIELKVDSSASAPPLAVINIYHFPSQARWKVNGLKMWKVDHVL